MGLDPVEITVHLIVGGDDLLGQVHILPDIGVHALADHADGGPGHIPQGVAGAERPAGAAEQDLGNIVGLVADTFHVRDHLQGSGDLPQVAGHRLLLKQEPQAEVLDVALLAVDLVVQGRDLLRQGGIAVGEGLRGQSDDLLAQGAHLDKLAVELGQLFIELTTHYPNLPVM